MVIFVESDADMPSCLNDPSKQMAKALDLANIYFNNDAKEARMARPQGFFSRTVIVNLGSGKEIVIQFRVEILDITPFDIARRTLGSVVPEIQEISDQELRKEGIRVYWMNCMPGRVWCSITSHEFAESQVTTVRSLGRILSRGLIQQEQPLDILDGRLRSHLKLIQCSTDPEIQKFASVALDLDARLHLLEPLPIYVSHFDLNDVNILIDEFHQVSGIIDWELSTPLPFGMGFYRIHTLAGEYFNRKFRLTENYHEAEQGFWEEIWCGISADVRQVCDQNLNGVQVAVALGTLLNAFQVDDKGRLGNHSKTVMNALPTLLSYQIPMLRAEGQQPYNLGV